jgi:hypothetical protein
MIAEIVAYLRMRLPDSFSGWTNEALEDYVLFHVEQDTIRIGLHDGCVCGVLVGWRQSGTDIRPWQWQPNDPSGDHWYWHQFAAESPIVAMAIAAKFFLDRPDSALLPAVGIRNGRHKVYLTGSLPIYQAAQRKHGIC